MNLFYNYREKVKSLAGPKSQFLLLVCNYNLNLNNGKEFYEKPDGFEAI